SRDRLPGGCHHKLERNQREYVSCPRSLQLGADNRLILERAAHRAVDLIVLMSLAGDQHHIAGSRTAQRGLNRTRPVVLNQDGGCFSPELLNSGEYVGDDTRGILRPGVIVCNEDIIGKLRRNPAHQRSFSRIAITSAAKHNTEPSAAMEPRGT